MPKISVAGAGLLVWVNAIVNYHKVAVKVEPLRQKVREMTLEQKKSEKELKSTKELVARLSKELKELGKKKDASVEELSGLKITKVLLGMCC